jgi:serine/threonine protein kinase
MTLQVVDEGIRQAPAVVKIRRLTEDEADAFNASCAELSEIRHPNVAVPYTHGIVSSSDGTYGYATREFIHGAALGELVLPLPELAVHRIAAQVAHGLDALHSRGVMHRDLKLENVVVRRSRGGTVDELSQCILIDQGYRSSRNDGPAELGEVTLQYAAPELFEGSDGTPQSDLYALGVLLYAALVGQLPFTGHSVAEILHRQRVREFAPIRHARVDIDTRLAGLAERLLEPNPTRRPRSAQEVLALLSEVLRRGPAVTPLLWPSGPPLVGRTVELDHSLSSLIEDTQSAGLEVVGEGGSGVTTVLRELQDRIESRGRTVLTAQPYDLVGHTIQEQLRRPVHELVRRTGGDSIARHPASTSELLDDLAIASNERHIVLFVDEWAACGTSELEFLRRVALQCSARVGKRASNGSCKLVLGNTVGGLRAPRFQQLRTVTLPPLCVADVATLSRWSAPLREISEGECALIADATGGRPNAHRQRHR